MANEWCGKHQRKEVSQKIKIISTWTVQINVISFLFIKLLSSCGLPHRCFTMSERGCVHSKHQEMALNNLEISKS